jgi:hypothetical protein
MKHRGNVNFNLTMQYEPTSGSLLALSKFRVSGIHEDDFLYRNYITHQ